MPREFWFWNCDVCKSENHVSDEKCQQCECQHKDCEKDNCSDPKHFENESEALVSRKDCLEQITGNEKEFPFIFCTPDGEYIDEFQYVEHGEILHDFINDSFNCEIIFAKDRTNNKYYCGDFSSEFVWKEVSQNEAWGAIEEKSQISSCSCGASKCTWRGSFFCRAVS